MLFCIAFLFQFLIAGLTGIMLGVAPFDWQLNDSYFVIAHFHYVIVGGILYALCLLLLLVPESIWSNARQKPWALAFLAYSRSGST